MFDIMKNSRLYKFLRKIAGDEVSITPANVFEDCLDDIADAVAEGGGGTSDYADLINKPSINGVTLSGDKSLEDLGAIFHVSMTESSGYLIPDKTASEIYEAHLAGKRIVFSFTYEFLPIMLYDTAWTIVSSTVYGVSASGLSSSVSGGLTMDYSSTEGKAQLVTYPIRYAVLSNNDGDGSYSIMVYKRSDNSLGYVKAYDTTGNGTDGTMTQAAITTAINDANPYVKIDTTTASQHATFRTGFTTLFDSVVASAVAAAGTRVRSASSFSCSSVTNLLVLSLGLAPKVPQLLITAAGQTLMLFLSSQYYNHFFFRAVIPYNDGTNDYELDCTFLIESTGMSIAMTAYQA